MKNAQVERNELLRYALQHPPANVVVKLPDGFDSFDSIDLALCPSPLPLYAEAESAAANAKGGKAPVFLFDMKDCFVFVGGSSGGVQRASPSPVSGRSRRQKSPRSGHSSPEPKTESSSPKRGRRPANDVSGATSTIPGRELTLSVERDHTSEPQQKIVAAEQSAPHPASAHGTQRNANSNGTPATEPEPSKGFLAQIVGTFRGLAGGEPSSNGGTPSTRASPTHAQRGASRAPTGIKVQPSGSGLLASLWNPLSSVRAARNASQRASSAGILREAPGTPDTVRRTKQLQIPLCGSTPGTMLEVITSQFGPVFDAVEERRRASITTMMMAKEFPKPPNIQLCEVLNSAPVASFLDILPVFAYDTLVLYTNVLATKKHSTYDREMRNVYRRVLNISDEQHRRTVANVTPPALKAPLNESDPAAVAGRWRYIADIRGDATLLRLLCEESTDDDYVNRTEQLLYCIENFPDSPGDAQIPFSIRAMIYAVCLLPLYQLDLSTLSPIYVEADVENCLVLLRARLGISPQIEQYCHLHAQLLANDQCGSVEAQAVFLKDVARAVSSLGARNIADSPLTPPTKYAYYVLQETFCLAAVPMPWLDSTFSYDMQRSVSAVFIEACLALPSCMLSAMLLVEETPVLPPTADCEAFLLAFMEVFVNSGVYRNCAELLGNDDDAEEHVPSTTSAAALLRQVSSSLDRKQKAYCKMLTRSFPPAMFLLVPGRLRIGAYILLVRHWGGMFPDKQQDEVPKDFHVAMDAFLSYLLGACGEEKRVGFSNHLSSLLMRCVQTYLAPFSVLAKREEASFANVAQKQLETLQLEWATTLDEAREPQRDIRHFLRTVFEAPRPPPLGSDPASQHHARLTNWMHFATALTQRCMDGVPQVTAAPSSSKMPYIAAEYERIRAAAATRTEGASLLPGVVQRLHTVVEMKATFSDCLGRLRRSYDLVRSVSGAPAVGTKEVKENRTRSIYDAVLQLCDTISIEIMSSGTVRNLLEKFMRLDVKLYRASKSCHGKADEFPMPRAFPDVTMRRIIDAIKDATAVVCAHLDYEPAVQQVHYRVGHNFVAHLFSVYVDGAGVFLCTADAPLILGDLDLVREAFFETTQKPSQSLSEADAVNNACKAVAHVMRTSGEELLEKLYGIVQYVMSRPSAELTNGGAGVPPLHTLPESSDDSPWCQFVVRRVLEHRKDFKKSMWINYQARQRTKSMY